MAEGFELGDESALAAVAVAAPVEVVAAEVVVGLAVQQNERAAQDVKRQLRVAACRGPR